MHRCWAMLILIALPAARDAAAQTLDLDAPVPAAAPPPLGLQTYAGARLRALQDEADAIAAQLDGTTGSDQVALAAQQRMRRLAAELFDLGDRTGAGGSGAVLAAVRLDRGRAAIDALLAELPARGSAAAEAALARFVAAPSRWPEDLEPGDARAFDTLLAQALGPLAEAVEILASGETASHWITQEAIDVQRGRAVADLEATLASAEARIASAEIDEETRTGLQRVLGFLQRGVQFGEFRPWAARYARLLSDALDAADAMQGAAWIDQPGRDACAHAFSEAFNLFAERATRDAGEQALRDLVALRPIAERITRLAEVDRAAAPGRARSREPRLDLAPVQSGFLAIVAATGSGQRDPQQARRFVEILEGMIAYREMRRPPITRELQITWRKLNEQYRRTEHALVEKLPLLVAGQGAMGDPAVVAVVTGHAQYLEDLQRLARLPEWIETIKMIDPAAAGPFGGQVRKLSAWLADAGRRPAAVRKLDALDAQMSAYVPFPFEAELRTGDEAAIIATGGLVVELADALDSSRRLWAEAWAADRWEAIEPWMRRLHELMQTMADTAALLRLGEAAALLNGWAAWEIDAMSVDRLSADLRNRLKLATRAAVDGDEAGLAQQLDRLQTPPAALYDRLAAALLEPLQALPEGALSVIGQSVNPAPANAWLLHRRAELADLCRYFMELEYARATGRTELAGKLNLYVNSLAEQLLLDPEIMP